MEATTPTLNLNQDLNETKNFLDSQASSIADHDLEFEESNSIQPSAYKDGGAKTTSKGTSPTRTNAGTNISKHPGGSIKKSRISTKQELANQAAARA